MENIANQLKPSDTSKYNLRCNRNISEKMTKKDFIYDIPAPFQAVRRDRYLPSSHALKKPREHFGCLITSNGVRTAGRSEQKLNKNPVQLLSLIQSQNSTAAVTSSKSSTRQPELEEIRRQIVLPIHLRRKIGSEFKAPRHAIPERKILGYQCNHCHERLATLLSLSTHVKYHRESHCSICYWIPQPDESMAQHVQREHPVNVPAHVPISDHP